LQGWSTRNTCRSGKTNSEVGLTAGKAEITTVRNKFDFQSRMCVKKASDVVLQRKREFCDEVYSAV